MSLYFGLLSGIPMPLNCYTDIKLSQHCLALILCISEPFVRATYLQGSSFRSQRLEMPILFPTWPSPGLINNQTKFTQREALGHSNVGCCAADGEVSAFRGCSVYLPVQSKVRRGRVCHRFGLFYWRDALQGLFFFLRALRGRFIFQGAF